MLGAVGCIATWAPRGHLGASRGYSGAAEARRPLRGRAAAGALMCLDAPRRQGPAAPDRLPDDPTGGQRASLDAPESRSMGSPARSTPSAFTTAEKGPYGVAVAPHTEFLRPLGAQMIDRCRRCANQRITSASPPGSRPAASSRRARLVATGYSARITSPARARASVFVRVSATTSTTRGNPPSRRLRASRRNVSCASVKRVTASTTTTAPVVGQTPRASQAR